MNKADQYIQWTEDNCIIPQGDGEGEKVSLMAMQKQLYRGAFRRGIKTIAWSWPRSNTKSTTAGFKICLYLFGPLVQKNTQINIVASSIDQGNEIFSQVIPQLPDDRKWGIRDSFNVREIECPVSGVLLKVLGSNPRHMMGKKTVAWFLDEPQSWGPQSEKCWAAIRSSTGKIPGSKVFMCGTMTDNENHWFSRQILGEADYAQLYQSRAKKTWWSDAAMRKANPAFPYLKTLRDDLQKLRDEARKSPEAAEMYRALNLNQGGDGSLEKIDVLIQAKDYKRLEVESVEIQPGRYVLGLDPADGFSQFGVCAISLDGDVDGFAAWPEVDNDLAQRSKKDGIDYKKWQRAGDLVLTSGPVTDIGEVIETAFSRWGRPVAIVCDLFRFRELRFVLEKHGYSQDQGTLVTRRASWGDGSEDYRAFARAVRAGELSFRKSDALRDTFSQARKVGDSSGNIRQAKFHERSTRGRDDIAAACLFAVGEVARRSREVQGTGTGRFIHVPLAGSWG